jgi:hypothetical protein
MDEEKGLEGLDQREKQAWLKDLHRASGTAQSGVRSRRSSLPRAVRCDKRLSPHPPLLSCWPLSIMAAQMHVHVVVVDPPPLKSD